MLIVCGADVTAQNKNKESPLHLASTRSHWIPTPPRQYAELALILLEHGADVTVEDKYRWTPFDLASSSLGHAEVAHVFLCVCSHTVFTPQPL